MIKLSFVATQKKGFGRNMSSRRIFTVARRSLFMMPKLEYPVDGGLLPAITPKGLDLHYNKHHQTYVTNANKLVLGTPYESTDLEKVRGERERREKTGKKKKVKDNKNSTSPLIPSDHQRNS